MYVQDLDLFVTVQLRNASSSIARKALLRTRMFMREEKPQNSIID